MTKTSKDNSPTETEREVAAAIMRAFFSRPIELQTVNVTIDDNIDLAQAALGVVSWYNKTGTYAQNLGIEVDAV